jgi:hypothetical protein
LGNHKVVAAKNPLAPRDKVCQIQIFQNLVKAILEQHLADLAVPFDAPDIAVQLDDIQH